MAEDGKGSGVFLPEDKRNMFGSKTIGFFAGTALLINNITGPGIPQLPNMFAEAGWLLPTICIFLVWATSTVSASMYCEAMRKIPGNEHFKDRLEYSSIVKYYFGRNWYLASQIGLNGALQSLNIISVIQSAQVMDAFISKIFGATCGFNLTPFQSVWTDADSHAHNLAHSTEFLSCVNLADVDTGNPWGCHIVLSAGYLLVAAMAIPCGRWNLDDNMMIQVVAFILTVAFWLIWVAGSFVEISNKASTGDVSLPAINNQPGVGSQAAWLGNILFNFGYVTTVPSWVNEKRANVSVNKTLWVSTTACIGVFFAIGIIGALAYGNELQGLVTNTCAAQVANPGFNCPNDLMQALTQKQTRPTNDGFSTALLELSVYMFPIAAVVSSIPIFSIVIKYNLLENGFSNGSSFAFAVVFPWLIGFPLLYMPNVLAQVVNFTSLIFVTFTDFIVPLLLYVKLQNQRNEHADLSENNSTLGQELVDEGVHAHYAFPKSWGISSGLKIGSAYFVVAFLGVAAFIACIQSIFQGDYTFDKQVCSLVGS